MMKFDLISDFHVEMNVLNPDPDGPEIYPWDKEKSSDVLVMAGDTSNCPEVTLEVLDEAAEYYPCVIFVDGNHDHYIGYKTGRTVGQNIEIFQNHGNPRVHFLDAQKHVQLESTVFIGACGWYDWKSNQYFSRNRQHEFWKAESNDGRCIRFDPDGYPDKMAVRQADSLTKMVEQFQHDETVSDIVVVTHTIPNRKAAISDTHPWGHLNGSYENTEMQRLIDADETSKISTWVFGHTHFLYDFVDQGIRFKTNPRGYRGERRSPQFTEIVTIDTKEDIKSAFHDSNN